MLMEELFLVYLLYDDTLVYVPFVMSTTARLLLCVPQANPIIIMVLFIFLVLVKSSYYNYGPLYFLVLVKSSFNIL